jgi:hypothetical protein
MIITLRITLVVGTVGHGYAEPFITYVHWEYMKF